ncbi:trigger factor [Sansalvadorimonas sp. 2012CJ34-2]|uniref:Trigger factor n=1 Tax=Parendozoicomonas callyspongiae TaxID=2942213 RepID=A0ABT0PBG4_9GAMM|nr:trigger factor [Sansalvadorimonas sp. 2012CJ34-2]MCL6268728.1 trigger factor [Sansalvadorimonas sp. 2012CJ34-2]
MQVSLETTSGLERRLTIIVPAETVDVQVDKRLKDMGKRVKLDGFRPGKVPFKVVKRRYGQGARQEVLGEVIQSSYTQAVIKEELHPAGAPRIEPKVMDEGADLEFVAIVEVYPEIELGDFSNIFVEKPVAEVAEDDVSKMLETLREQSKTFEEVEEGTVAELGDQVVIDFKGSVDGEEFEGGAAENQDLELGSGRMIPGFEDGIVGMKSGEQKDITVTFPEDYQAENLKGKEAVFAINLKAVKKGALPELDEAFFERYGVKEGGEEAFRAEITKNMGRELRQAVKTKVKNQVMDGLLSIHEVELPAALVDQEIDRLREQAVQQFGGQGMQADQLPAEIFRAEAEKRVRLGLIVGEVVKAKELKADDNRVREMIEEIASAYQEPQQVVDWYYGNEQQLSQVQYVVLEEQVVDTILEAAQVSEKTCGYEEAIKPAPAKKEEGAEEGKTEA